MRVNHTYPALDPAVGRSVEGYSAEDHSARALAEILVQSVHEAFGVKPGLIRTNEHGEILGHLARLQR